MRFAGLLLIPALLSAEILKLPEPYRSIVELSHAAPPEFAADALLRVVESGKLTDKDARRDLVEQAFRLAASAKFSVRMRQLAGTATDTRSGFLGKAYDLKLDALSLQSRATRDMLSIDKPKARELFLAISKPSLAPLTCDDPLAYDVSDFYPALEGVADLTFSDKERKKEEHVNFLLDYLGQITSPAALAPMARVIKSVNVTPEQREILWNRFNGLLESMQPDDRSFAAALEDISREIPPLSQASLEKFKQRSPGCPDDKRASVTINLSTGPVQTGSTPKVERYWQSPAAQRMLTGAKSLRFTPDGKLRSDADRATREWQRQLTDFLSELADWTPDQEKSEADYYHQKCVVYEALVELIPPGPQRDKALQAYVNFISNSNLESQSPVEWFMHPHSMLERVRNTNTGEPAKVLEAFENSGNPVLALYAALERTFTGSVPSWVTNSH